MQSVNSDYKLIYHKSAVKFITKLDKASQERITTGLKGLTIYRSITGKYLLLLFTIN